MKVLIVSSSTWDNSNSFGNTFSNLFKGMTGVEVYNICCAEGKINNTVVKRTLQLTDKSVLKSIVSGDPAKIIENECIQNETQVLCNPYFGIKHRWRVLYFLREILWYLGSWKKSSQLKNFLDEVKPDVIYLPMYASWYMCNVQSYIVEYLKIPVVGHITDDIYGFRGTFMSAPLDYIYRYVLRGKLRSLISKASYIEVYAQNMVEEYTKVFGKECYIIGKGVHAEDIDSIPSLDDSFVDKSTLHFVYTGVISDDRFEVLYELGRVFSCNNGSKKLILDIYTTTKLTNSKERLLKGLSNVVNHGSVLAERVKEIQSNADFLAHVEGFSNESIINTRMSFSTKIIDYMLRGKPILAIGPAEVNSIQELKDNNLAFVIDDVSKMGNVVAMVQDDHRISELLENVKKYLKDSRDIQKIQKQMSDRLFGLVNKTSL